MKHPMSAWLVASLAGSGLVVSAMPGCAKGYKASSLESMPSNALQAPVPFIAPSRSVSEVLPSASLLASNNKPAKLLSSETFGAEASGGAGAAGGAEGLSPSTVIKQPGELLKVKYAANNVPVAEVLHVLIGDLLNRPYVVDPKITGMLTLDIDEEMTRAEIIDFVGSLASVYDWAIEDRDGVLFFRPAGLRPRIATAPVLTTASAIDTELPAIRVKKLRYATPQDVVTVLKEVMSEQGKQLPVGRLLVMVDTTRQVNRAAKLISVLDVPAFEGVTMWMYRLGTRTPDDAAKILDQLANGSKLGGQGVTDPVVQFIPISGSDRLMVLTRDPGVQSLVRTFIEQVDQPPEKSQRERYLYHVQYFDPQALMKFAVESLGDRIDNTPTSLTPGAAPAAGAQRRDPRAIRMVLEPTERILMVEATPSDYADILSLLRAVDRPKMQVFINSTIAEVTLQGNLEFGVQYFFQGDAVKGLGIFGLTGSPGLPVGNPTGSVFFSGADGLALVQALQKETRVDILSQPRVFVRDNTKATIEVGGEQPIATSSSDTTSQNQGSTLARTDIKYQNTGVKLDILPKLNESGMITMKITQENRVQAPGDTSTQAGQISPAFTTRRIETEVTVPSGRTIVLGGIIDRSKINNVSKIPLLGDLPLLGPMFRSTSDVTKKTELLLTITPTIVPEPTDVVPPASDFMLGAVKVREVLSLSLDDLPRGMLNDPALGYRSPVAPTLPAADLTPTGTAPSTVPPAEPPQ